MPNNEFEKKLHFKCSKWFYTKLSFLPSKFGKLPIKFTPIKVLFTMYVVITNNMNTTV